MCLLIFISLGACLVCTSMIWWASMESNHSPKDPFYRRTARTASFTHPLGLEEGGGVEPQGLVTSQALAKPRYYQVASPSIWWVGVVSIHPLERTSFTDWLLEPLALPTHWRTR